MHQTFGGDRTTTVRLPVCDTVGPGVDMPSAIGAKYTYVNTLGPARHPHKGWNAGWRDNHAESSVGFST